MGMKANSNNFRGTSGYVKAVAGDKSYMNANDPFIQNIKKRKDIDPNGKFDLIAHGTPNSIEIEHNNKKVQINSRSAAKIIRNMPGYKKGQPIRLLSCNTGARSVGFAQNLANKLNVNVYAPNNVLWSYPTGEHIIAPRDKTGSNPDLSKPGKFIKFVPGGNKK